MFKTFFAVTIAIAGWTNSALAEPLKVNASHGVIADFARQIGGADVVVTMGVPAGTDPALWLPSIADITAMQEADLILLNGADYEGWVDRVSLPRAKTVRTIGTDDLDLIRLSGVAHSHGDGPAHTHEGIAAQTWLDFSAAAKQAQNIAMAMTRAAPESAEQVTANLERLTSELAALDAQARELGTAFAGRTLLVPQPGYEYLARAYGFVLTEATFDPVAPATADQLTTLEAIIAATDAEIMLWPGPVNDAIQSTLDDRGIVLIEFDTGTNPAADIAFTALMRRNLNNLQNALQQ